MIPASCTIVLLHVAFRFRYRKVWGFKSLLVHNVGIVGERDDVRAGIVFGVGPPSGPPPAILGARWFGALQPRRRFSGEFCNERATHRSRTGLQFIRKSRERS